MNADLPSDILRIILGRFSNIFTLVRFELTFVGARSIVSDQLERIDETLVDCPGDFRLDNVCWFLSHRLPDLSGTLRELVLRNPRYGDISFDFEAPFPRMHDLVLPGGLEFELSTVVNRNIIRRIYIAPRVLDDTKYVSNFQRLFSAELPKLETLRLSNCLGISSLFPLIAKNASMLKKLELYMPSSEKEPLDVLLQGLADLSPSLQHLRRIKLLLMFWHDIKKPLKQTKCPLLFSLIRVFEWSGNYFAEGCRYSYLSSVTSEEVGFDGFMTQAIRCHPYVFKDPDDRDMKDLAETIVKHMCHIYDDDDEVDVVWLMDMYANLAFIAIDRYKWFPNGDGALPSWYHRMLTACMLVLRNFSKHCSKRYYEGIAKCAERTLTLLLSKSQRGLNHALAACRRRPGCFQGFLNWMAAGKIYTNINEKIHPALLDDDIFESDSCSPPPPNELEHADLDYMGYSHVLMFAVKHFRLFDPIIENKQLDLLSPVLPSSSSDEPVSLLRQSNICQFFRLDEETEHPCRFAGYRLKRTPQPLVVLVLQGIDQRNIPDPNPDDDFENIFLTYGRALLERLNPNDNVMEQVQPRGNLVDVLWTSLISPNDWATTHLIYTCFLVPKNDDTSPISSAMTSGRISRPPKGDALLRDQGTSGVPDVMFLAMCL